MPLNSDTTQEVKFWTELESALGRINDQLQSPEAQCTLNTLKRAKRFHATVAFDSDTIGIKKTMKMVANFKVG